MTTVAQIRVFCRLLRDGRELAQGSGCRAAQLDWTTQPGSAGFGTWSATNWPWFGGGFVPPKWSCV